MAESQPYRLGAGASLCWVGRRLDHYTEWWFDARATLAGLALILGLGVGLVGSLIWLDDVRLAAPAALAVLGATLASFGLVFSVRRWREIGQRHGGTWARYEGRHVRPVDDEGRRTRR